MKTKTNETLLPLSRFSALKLFSTKSFLLSLVLLVLFFVFSGKVSAAVITTTGSGDYSSTTPNAPWPGGTIPDYVTDTVVVASGHTLTISDTRNVPAITISNGATASESVLTLAATANVTAFGKLLLNGDINGNYKAKLNLTGGSQLNMQANAIKIGGGVNGSGYSKFYTVGTSASSYAYLTGSGARFEHYTSTYNYISLNYLNVSGFNSAAGPNILDGFLQFSITNSKFYNCSGFIFGNSNIQTTWNTYLNNNDFRRITARSGMPEAGATIAFVRADGAKTGTFQVNGNTFPQAAKFSIIGSHAQINNNVMYQISSTGGSSSMSGNIRWNGTTSPLPSLTNTSPIINNTASFTGQTTLNYKVQIDGTGTTFKWSNDGGTTWDFENIALVVDTPIVLELGISLIFPSGTYVVGDSWTFTAVGGGGYVGFHVLNDTINGDVSLTDTYNNHGYSAQSITNSLHEHWGEGGNDQIYFTGGVYPATNFTFTRNLFLGKEDAFNQGGEIKVGATTLIKNNTMVLTGSYVGFVQENVFTTGKVKFSSNLVYSPSGTKMYDAVNSTHRELYYSDYNNGYVASGSMNRYASVVIPSLSAVTPTITGTKTLVAEGNFSGAVSTNYVVELDGTGTTFKWSDDGGSTWDATGVALTAGTYRLMNNGMYVKFSTTGTGVAGDRWAFTAGILTSDPDANPVEGGALNDKNVNPNFVDITRNVAKYVTANYGVQYNDIYARRLFFEKALTRNGTDIYGNAVTPDTLCTAPLAISYVSTGLTPQNSALKGTGEGGVDIGAVSVADTEAPTNAIISINAAATATNSNVVALVLSATDSFGVTQMKFSNDDVTYDDPVAYATSASHNLSAGNGTKTVYVKYGDAANNWSNAVSDTIMLDNVVPTSSANVSTGIFNIAQDVTLTCDDGTGSGCDEIYYTTNNTDPTTASDIYATPINIATTTTLKYFSQDLATNSETIKSEVYTIDTTLPNTSITSNPELITNSTTAAFQFDATEAATFECKLDNEEYAVCTSPKDYINLVEGEHTFYVKAIDNATNEDPTPAGYTWNIDAASPTTTPNIAGSTFNSAQSLTFSCTDNLAGCDKIYYTTDGSVPTTSSQIFSGTLIINATTTLKFFSQDLLGNSETPKTQIYTINIQQSDNDDQQTILIPNPKLYSNNHRKSFSTTLKSNKVKLSSTIVDLKGGSVKITSGSKTIKEVSIDEFGSWHADIKAKKFQLHYFNSGGVQVSLSKEYKLKIDDEKPKIKNLAPLYIKHRGSIITWQALDNKGIDKYLVTFGDKKFKTKKSQIVVPASVKKGPQTFTITAYDKVGNKMSKKGNLVVTW